jgi:hypothetical protein
MPREGHGLRAGSCECRVVREDHLIFRERVWPWDGDIGTRGTVKLAKGGYCATYRAPLGGAVFLSALGGFFATGATMVAVKSPVASILVLGTLGAAVAVCLGPGRRSLGRHGSRVLMSLVHRLAASGGPDE